MIDTSDLDTKSTTPDPFMDEIDIEKEKNKRKKKKAPFSLPWWFRIVGWILLAATTLTSSAFVLFYGVQFGDEKTKKWITSLLISFITSIFLTQPLKVFKNPRAIRNINGDLHPLLTNIFDVN